MNRNGRDVSASRMVAPVLDVSDCLHRLDRRRELEARARAAQAQGATGQDDGSEPPASGVDWFGTQLQQPDTSRQPGVPQQPDVSRQPGVPQQPDVSPQPEVPQYSDAPPAPDAGARPDAGSGTGAAVQAHGDSGSPVPQALAALLWERLGTSSS